VGACVDCRKRKRRVSIKCLYFQLDSKICSALMSLRTTSGLT
jgi:hypothetical protein